MDLLSVWIVRLGKDSSIIREIFSFSIFLFRYLKFSYISKSHHFLQRPQKFDMFIYDEAYDAMAQKQDIAAVLSCARRYFSKAQSETPIWEILSDRPAKAVKDISSFLKGLEE